VGKNGASERGGNKRRKKEIKKNKTTTRREKRDYKEGSGRNFGGCLLLITGEDKEQNLSQ